MEDRSVANDNICSRTYSENKNIAFSIFCV